jgi:8-oxo-dGTP pyrophosphatase MutT (NUDIX family)
MPAPTEEKRQELNDLRRSLRRGDNATQAQLDTLGAQWTPYREHLQPGEKDELLRLVDPAGHLTQLSAPRWLCHLLGLRHCCAHVLLCWQSAGLGRVFVLQVRSWTKSSYAGHLDISVGGHVSGDFAPEQTAYQEMAQELGLERADLQDGTLVFKKGYESFDQPPEGYTCNVEWRAVYTGAITTAELEKIRFADQEVVGLYLCPEAEAGNLLQQKQLPIASGLEFSLPHCL